MYVKLYDVKNSQRMIVEEQNNNMSLHHYITSLHKN